MDTNQLYTIELLQDGYHKVASLNAIMTVEKELFLPEEYEGLPLTHIGFEGYEKPGEMVWIDYQHFKEDYIPGGPAVRECEFSIPKTVRRIVLPKTVTDITKHFYMTNLRVHVVIDEENPYRKELKRQLREAKEYCSWQYGE